jgi:hypothetical protein
LRVWGLGFRVEGIGLDPSASTCEKSPSVVEVLSAPKE